MTAVSQLSALLVATPDGEEMLAHCGDLAGVEWFRCGNVASAVDCMREHPNIAIVVLASARPGEFEDEAVGELRRAAPLVRIWMVVGSWSEGEPRSGTPPAGVLRCYWHQFAARLGAELQRVNAGALPIWTLPATAGEEDRLAPAPTGARDRSGLVVVRGDHWEAIDALVDACRELGYQAIGADRFGGSHAVAKGALAIVWDTTASAAADVRQTQAVLHDGGHAPLVAVLGFPRPKEVRRALEAGASAVLSKPFRLEDLAWRLEEVASAPTC